MAVETIQFLMAKFVDGLGEEDGPAFPLRAEFQEIRFNLEKKVTSWMPLSTTDALREPLYCLNEMLSDCQALAKKRKRFYSPVESWLLYKNRKRLLSIKQRVESIQSEPYTITINSPSIEGEEEEAELLTEFDRWTNPAIDPSRVHGVDDQVNEMANALIERREFKGIGIVGTGGVGKTTAAQLLFNSRKVRRHFSPRLWVCLSQSIAEGKDIRREVLEKLLMSLGVEEDVISSMPTGDGLEELMLALYTQLMGKRYLVVFDDVWNVDEWYEGLGSEVAVGEGEWEKRLAAALPKGSGGGVVVTSRLEDVAARMVGGERNLYRVRALEDRESCWDIFMDAFAGDHRGLRDHPAVTGMKDEILERCGGLPLAARTIGEIMCRSLSQPGDSSMELSSRICTSASTSADHSGSLE